LKGLRKRAIPSIAHYRPIHARISLQVPSRVSTESGVVISGGMAVVIFIFGGNFCFRVIFIFSAL
jgi:hypothetical protein